MTTGIQLFMCLYGLRLYYETPKELRKGRGRFIVMSFMILFTFSVVVGLDSATVFILLLESGSNGAEILHAWSKVDVTWNAASTVILTTCTAIGDSLMVRVMRQRNQRIISILTIHPFRFGVVTFSGRREDGSLCYPA